MRIFNRMSFIALITAAMLFSSLIVGCDKKKPLKRPKIIPEVSTITIKSQKLMLKTRLPGRASAYRIAEIRPQVSGLILKRLFKEGSYIKKGQVLYQIDPAPFKAALNSARANLNVAKKSARQARAALKAGMARVTQQDATLKLAIENRKRFDDAFKGRAVSASQRDQAVTNANVAKAGLKAAKAELDSAREAVAVAKASIKQAEAAVTMARINLNYCRIIAPISGRIGRSSVTEGAIVTAYQPMALSSIQQLDPIYVDVPQSTTELLRLKRRIKDGRFSHHGADQNKAGLILEDNTPYPLNGVLKFSDVSVDATTGSVILRLVFPNPKFTLLPGMFVNAVIKEGIDEKAVLVPQQGVSRNRKGNPFAMIVGENNKVELRMLTLDRAIGNKWLVLAGLAPGDRVIVEGLQMLRPGTIVNAVPFTENRAGQGIKKNKEMQGNKENKERHGHNADAGNGGNGDKQPRKSSKGGK